MAALAPSLPLLPLIALITSFLCQAASAQFFAIPTVRDLSSGGCDAACASLASEFGSQLHYPHADKNFSVWDAKQQDSQRACRVEPKSTEEVATALGILINNWCTFAIKSGGHSSSKGASNSIGGVTVDLRRINQVELSDDKTQTRVGTGAVWGDVYRALEKENLAVVGGRVDDVGVGGLLTGGGISFLSARHGWATDNILEMEVVLPNTTIVTANEYCNPDLFFALRGGGGNNFGIVTHFTLATVSQGKIYGGQKFYTPDKMDALIDASYDLTMSDDPDIAFWTGYIWMPAKNATLALSQLMYSKDITESPSVYSEIDKIEALGSTMRTEYVSNFSMELKAGTPAGQRNWMSSVTFAPSKEQERRMVQIFKEEIEILKVKAKTACPAMTFQPIQRASINAMNNHGGNAIGIESDGPLTLLNVATSWTDSAEDNAAYEFRERLQRRFTESAAELGVLNKYVYMNYACSEFDDVFAGYKAENVERLKEIQKTIDPEGIFTSNGLCTGYFKLL